MRMLLLIVLETSLLGLVPALAADPTLTITSFPNATTNTSIHPNLMPGVAGVGLQADNLPCIGCDGLPAGALGLPPSYYIIAPYEGKGLVFYNSVEVGNLTGSATVTLQITEATTGKIILTSSSTGALPANATSMLAWTTVLPDTDGYEGLEKVLYTTTIGGLTIQNTSHIWVVHHTPGS